MLTQPIDMFDKEMTFYEFNSIIAEQPDGVILLEGRRSIPPDEFQRAIHLARFLAIEFPHLRFRSGNAEGSDQAFSEGVAQVDASRLQIIAPYSSHRKNLRFAGAIYDSPSSMSHDHEGEIAHKTVSATPNNKGLIENRGNKGRLAAKAAYLIRDTMKVVGHSDLFPKPICGLFYVDLKAPMTGGTGHTIRVCQQEGMTVILQNSWKKWTA